MFKIPVLLEMLEVRTRLDEKKNIFTCYSIEDCCARLAATTHVALWLRTCSVRQSCQYKLNLHNCVSRWEDHLMRTLEELKMVMVFS
jgi:hypothetical protein